MGREREAANTPERPDDKRLERLAKQETVAPRHLAVRDKATQRLLAIAGAGGSY